MTEIADSRPDDEEDDSEEGISLEELSQSYAKLLGQSRSAEKTLDSLPLSEPSLESPELHAVVTTEASEVCPVTPLSIIEAVLMVGRPDNGPITSTEISSLMRGVQEAEVVQWISDLNHRLEQHNAAFGVVEAGSGYRLQLADDLKFIADRFYGRVRQVHLNQSAIDCLALVAYQPGISREEIEEQRDQASGAILNQLVRRQLLEIRREGQGKLLKTRYYPSDRLVKLAGLASLEDLPQVEEWQR